MDRNQYSLRFDRMVVMSIIAHCLLLLFVSLLWGGSAVPAIKTVQLVIESRPVAREVIAEVKRESAPGRVKRDAFSTGSAEESLESLLERSTFPHQPVAERDAPNRKREDDFDYGSLRRDQESPDGRLDRNPDSKDMQAHRPSITDRDTRTKEGTRETFGRDDATRQSGKNGNPDIKGSDFGKQGDRGAGVTGLVNMRGRSLLYRPTVVLPERFSRQGISYSVQVEITVSEEGIVSRAAVLEPSGDSGLDLLLEQRARMYRFEAASPGTGVQTGTIVFTIQPR